MSLDADEYNWETSWFVCRYCVMRCLATASGVV